jgi:hypothetical protein
MPDPLRSSVPFTRGLLPGEEHLTVKGAADITGMSPDMIRWLARRRLIDAVLLGKVGDRAYLIEKNSVLAWAQNHPKRPGRTGRPRKVRGESDKKGDPE